VLKSTKTNFAAFTQKCLYGLQNCRRNKTTVEMIFLSSWV